MSPAITADQIPEQPQEKFPGKSTWRIDSRERAPPPSHGPSFGPTNARNQGACGPGQEIGLQNAPRPENPWSGCQTLAIEIRDH